MKAGSVETRTFYTGQPGADATGIYRSYIHTYLTREPSISSTTNTRGTYIAARHCFIKIWLVILGELIWSLITLPCALSQLRIAVRASTWINFWNVPNVIGAYTRLLLDTATSRALTLSCSHRYYIDDAYYRRKLKVANVRMFSIRRSAGRNII